jgi:hypothetical protein
MIALGRLRQPAVRRRFDFQTPVTRHAAGTRIIVADARNGIDIAAAVDGRPDLVALAETPLTLAYRLGCIHSVDDNGHAWATWNDDIEAAAGKGR